MEVEFYRYDIYVLKFYLKAHSQSANKYSLLSYDFDAPSVIRTVLDLAIEILEIEIPKLHLALLGHIKSKTDTKKANPILNALECTDI